ncbi:hypothetical protein OH768_24785 [Streptomyces sp. NBC_01622]|uniref:DUF6907 domain-containing protein n=1 Tax=Streptomyces sp. NBC_01622 TaxID=2975903 RepID=UPI0038637737|nr:hypothetical protein OH768_24785 [Streptomyces sp. NBC_01622]
MTSVIPEAPTASPAFRGQSISTVFHVEVMNDLDTGQPTLVASTQGNHGDLQVVTAEQVRRKANEVRNTIAQGEALAAAFEAATAPAPGPPRSFTYTHYFTGEQATYTCTPWCYGGHTSDMASPTNPVDIVCWSPDDIGGNLPVDANTGTSQTYDILKSRIAVEPFSDSICERLPHAVVEILDEHYIAPLDPDALAGVIDLLAERVEALRKTHAQLVRTRAEYIARGEATA